jgi:hypothetical protein
MTHARQPEPWLSGRRGRIAGICIAVAAVAGFAAANAHLIAVSFASQPSCVAHDASETGGGARYRAAKLSC